jgi:hypothetical protein
MRVYSRNYHGYNVKRNGTFRMLGIDEKLV